MEHIVNIAILLLYFAAGAAVYGHLEGWSPMDSCYFLMVTICTVGYGDIVPTNPMSKCFTCIYALVGMSSIFSMLEPVVEMLSNGIDVVEKAVTGFLENQGCIAPAVDTLDMSIPLKEINATINYPRRYFLALTNPLVIMLLGLAIATVVVEEGGWVDCLYFSIISMTTIGYGDITPKSPLPKFFVMLYLPLSVAVLAQALADVSAIGLRRSIRETDYGDKLAEKFLFDECVKKANADESITEGEFLVTVLMRRQLVDETTIAAIRRQFREIVRHSDDTIPVEERVFDCELLFREKVEREQIKQRPPNASKGSYMKGRKRKDRIPLVDIAGAADGGLAEWREHFWEPRLADAANAELAKPVKHVAPKHTKRLSGGMPLAAPIQLAQQAHRTAPPVESDSDEKESEAEEAQLAPTRESLWKRLAEERRRLAHGRAFISGEAGAVPHGQRCATAHAPSMAESKNPRVGGAFVNYYATQAWRPQIDGPMPLL